MKGEGVLGLRYFSQRHFPKGDFPSDNFPSGNFLNVQFSKRLYVPKVRPSEAPQAAKGGRALRLEQAGGGASATTITVLESCRVRNFTFGKFPLWNIPLGSCYLEKNP